MNRDTIDPNKLIERLFDENPGASLDVVEKLFIAEIDNNPDLEARVLECVFSSGMS